MEMSDALMIGRTQQWSGGNDVLGIGIAYGLQCTELPLEGRIAVDDPRHLHVNTLVRTGAYEINLSSTKLAHSNRIAQMYELMIHHILHNLLNVSLPFASCYIIPKTDIAKIGLARGFEQFLAVNVIAANGSGKEGLLEKRHVVEDNIGRNIHPLRLHVSGNVACRMELAGGIGHEAYEVMQKRDIADAVALYHVFQDDGVVDAREVFPHPVLVIDADCLQSGESTIVEVFPERIIAVSELMKLQELHVGETLHQNLFVSPSEQSARYKLYFIYTTKIKKN